MVKGRPDTLGPRLFDPPPVDEQSLTDRQQFVLQALRDHPEGLTGEQAGRLVHDYFVPMHSAGCVWCGQAGLAILKSLKARDLVALRRGGRWQSVQAGGLSDAPPAAPDKYDPQTSDWPPGFGDEAA